MNSVTAPLFGVMNRAKQLLEETTLKLFTNIEDMLLDTGFSATFINGIHDLRSGISGDIIAAVGPEYFGYNILRNYKKYKNYPFEFAINLSNKAPSPLVLSNDIYSAKGVYYSMKPAEKNILILRPDEVFDDPSQLINLLGSSNDGRYNVLEVLGMYHLLKLKILPDLFIKQVWLPAVRRAANGEDLRNYIKAFTISIKRWPDYWEAIYQTESSYIAETETVLGYIIKEEMEQSHIESIRDSLVVTPIRFAGTAAEFWETADAIIDTWPVNGKRDINFDGYLNNWNLWTTSGSAPEFRVKTREGKDLRVNKSALPLVITKSELLNAKNDYSRVIQKAEVGKNRIAYSTPTLNTIQEGYFSYKYRLEENPRMFPSLSNSQKLSWSANVIDEKKMLWASSDIEKNDFIHSTYLDTYIMARLLSHVLDNEADVLIAVEVLMRNMTNKVYVRGEMHDEWKDILLKVRKSGVVLEGSGAIMSGRRWTSLINSIINYFFNQIASRTVIKYDIGKVLTNFFGGDDSIQAVASLVAGIFIFVIQTSLLLTINPTKSFISSYSAEFFRVQFKIGNKRKGYFARVLHSIVSNNPVSTQEIDVVTKLKAFWANCQQIIRRSDNKGSDYLWNLLLKLARINNARHVIDIAPANGGCGLSFTAQSNNKIASPGIPRFRQEKSINDYELRFDWFDECMQVLDPGVEGIRQSYVQDMLEGIRDIDNRVEQRKEYKTKMRAWTPLITYGPSSMHFKGYNTQVLVQPGPTKSVEIINSGTQLNRSRARQYFQVLGNYQTYIDVMSRGIFPRFKDKLEYLTRTGILWLNGSYRNTKSAYSLKSIMLSSFDVVGSVLSLPPDMNYIQSDDIPAMIGFQKVVSPSSYYQVCSTYWESNYLWLTKLSPWALGW